MGRLPSPPVGLVMSLDLSVVCGFDEIVLARAGCHDAVKLVLALTATCKIGALLSRRGACCHRQLAPWRSISD